LGSRSGRSVWKAGPMRGERGGAVPRIFDISMRPGGAPGDGDGGGGGDSLGVRFLGGRTEGCMC